MSQFSLDSGAAMFPVVFVLLLIITSIICSGERQEILLEYESSVENGVNKLQCKHGEFYLKDALPTVIILNTTQTVWNHTCYTNGMWWNVTKFNKINNGAEGIVVKFLKGESNEHHCTFHLHKNNNIIEPQVQLEDGNYTELNCSFSIHMKYNWKYLTLAINSELAKTAPVLYSQKVDLQYTYEFVENELIKVECNKPIGDFGRLYFVYSGNNLNYSSVQKPADAVSFEVILGTKQNNSHVDCIFSNCNYNVTLRTYFFLKYREAIRVNGLAIRSRAKEFIYEYYGKLPSVVCPGAESDAELINKTHKYDLYDVSAVCSVEGENKTLLIVKKEPDFGFFIEGLSLKNMLLKSCNGPFCIIYYEYADGDVITLNSSVDNFTCDRNDSLTSEGIYTLQMKSDVYMTNITCFIIGNESLKTTLIFFVSDKAKENRKPEITAGDDSTNGYPKYSNNSASGRNSNKDIGAGSFFRDHIKAVGGIVLFILLLLVLTSIVCVVRKRKKPTTEGVQSNVDYVNLGHKNNEQFPKRLNADVYLNPQESSDYAVPVDNSVDTTLYSVPYKNKPTEELYSKPVPKNQRGYVNHEEVQYAAIAFNKPQDKYTNDSDTEYSYAYAQVHVRPEDLYAKVQPKGERNDTSPQNCADYVEPSYCEVGAIRK